MCEIDTMRETTRPYPGSPLTVRLPSGFQVLAREGGDAFTYSNRRQAQNRANWLNLPQLSGTGAVALAAPPPGAGRWIVWQPGFSRVFFVCWEAAPVEVRAIEPAETAFEVTERALAAEEACADWHEVL